MRNCLVSFIVFVLPSVLSQRTYLWTWRSGGDFIPDETPTSSVTLTGVPTPRSLHSSVLLENGSILVFGGYTYTTPNVTLYNDAWIWSPQTGWSQVYFPTSRNGIYNMGTGINVPGARSGAAMVYDNRTGTAWLFGGYGYDSNGIQGYLNDLWAFDLKTSPPKWIYVKGSQTVDTLGTYGTKGSPGGEPGGRSRHSMAIDVASRSIWVYGGKGPDSQSTLDGYLNDLWHLSLTTNLWTWTTGATLHTQRKVHASPLGVTSPSNDPGSRAGHTFSFDSRRGRLYLFGGQFQEVANVETTYQYNDLWAFDVNAGMWIWLSGSSGFNSWGLYNPNPGVDEGNNYMPAARWSHAMDWDGENLWVYGGLGVYNILGTASQNLFLNDLWRWSSTSGRWLFMAGTPNRASGAEGSTFTVAYSSFNMPNSSNLVGPRQHHSAVFNWETGELFILMGQGLFNQNIGWLNDIFSYQFTCNPGFYGDAAKSSGCVACPTGTFKSNFLNSDLSSCERCPINSGTPGNASKSVADCLCSPGYTLSGGECVPCPVNTYKNSISNAACLPCDSKSSTDGLIGITSASGCKCMQGYFGSGNNTCTVCPVDTYKDIIANGLANEVCLRCNSTMSTTNGKAGSTSSAACLCKAGYYGFGNTLCQFCPMGTYKPFVSNGDLSVCTNCTANALTNPGVPPDNSTACQCAPGYFGLTSSLPTTCSPCLIGTYKAGLGNGASTLCLSCPSGRTTLSTASPDIDSCSVCAAGYGGNATDPSLGCLACPANTYKMSAGNGECTPCGKNMVTTTVGLKTSPTVCLCAPGFSLVSGSCQPCGVDTYKVAASNGTCSACPSYSTTNGTTAASNINQCLCNGGYKFVSGNPFTCTTCSANQWKPMGNMATCNTVNNAKCAAPASSPSACTCNVGFEGDATTGLITACTACSVDSYKMTQSNGNCTSCAIGSSTFGAIGATNSNQCRCLRGYYGNAGANSNCKPCLADTYKDSVALTGVASSCKSCPPSTTTIGTTGAAAATACMCIAGFSTTTPGTACNPCPLGSYSSLGSNTCTACPSNSVTSSVGASNQAACVCLPGYQGDAGVNGGTCSQCPIGMYKSTAGNANCTPCPENSTTLDLGSTSRSQCVCLPGYGGSAASTGSGCTSCSIGTYKSTPANTPCSRCPLGSTTNEENSLSLTDCRCSAGFKGSAIINSCTECPAGTFKSFIGDEDYCDACPRFSNTTTTGSVSIADCLCDPGYGGDAENQECTLCPIGTYKSFLGNTACKECVPGATTQMEGSKNVSDCQCQTGFGAQGSYCAVCPYGTYSIPGSGLCQQCPENSNTTMQGATNQSSCECLPGYGGDASIAGGQCTICSVGYFKEYQGSGSCIACPSHSSTLDVGSIGRDSCMCLAGFEGSADSAGNGCTSCKLGYYKERLSNSACMSCPENSNTTLPGATSINVCQCNPGYRGSAESSSCTVCEFGTFKSYVGNSNICGSCPANSNTTRLAASSLFDCSCNPGYGGNASVPGGQCIACSFGHFKDKQANSICTPCPTNSSTAQRGSTLQNSCLCLPGFEGLASESNEGCHRCDIGYYKEDLSNERCKSCPGNSSTTFIGASKLEMCQCNPGYKWNASNYRCTACEYGTFKSNFGNEEICNSCPRNSNTREKAAKSASDCSCNPGFGGDASVFNGTCRECPRNWFKDGYGNRVCDICPANTATLYSGSASRNSCLCLPGFEGPVELNGGCRSCKLGFYKNETRNGACTACPANTNTTAEGAASIDACQCSAGYSRGHTAASVCAKCPHGTYKTYTGNTSDCDACPLNSNTTKVGSLSKLDCSCNPGYGGDASKDSGTCLACAIGSYKATQGNTECLPCSNGSTTLSEASTGCVCSKGYYGLYGDMNFCQPCPIGTFADTEAVGDLSRCIACALGTTTLEEGSDGINACSACAVGFGGDALDGGCLQCDTVNGYYKDNVGNEPCARKDDNDGGNGARDDDTNGSNDNNAGSGTTSSGSIGMIAGAAAGGAMAILGGAGLFVVMRRRRRDAEKNKVGIETGNLPNNTTTKNIPEIPGTSQTAGNTSSLFAWNWRTPKPMTIDPEAADSDMAEVPSIPAVENKNTIEKRGPLFQALEAGQTRINAQTSEPPPLPTLPTLPSTKGKLAPLGSVRKGSALAPIGSQPREAVEVPSKDKVDIIPEVTSTMQRPGPDNTVTGGTAFKKLSFGVPEEDTLGPLPSTKAMEVGGSVRGLAKLPPPISNLPPPPSHLSSLSGPQPVNRPPSATGSTLDPKSLPPVGRQRSLTATSIQDKRGPTTVMAPAIPSNIKCTVADDFVLNNRIGGTELADVHEALITSPAVGERSGGLIKASVKVYKPQQSIVYSGQIRAQVGWWVQLSKHPNIAKVLAVAEDPSFSIVTPIYESSLAKMIMTSGKMPMQHWQAIRDIVSGLQRIHMMGVTHANLKAENIMFENMKGSYRVVLMDMGLDLTPAQSRKGNLPYQAPEMLHEAKIMQQATVGGEPSTNSLFAATSKSDSAIAKKADIYSLAILIYEIVEGKRAWSGVSNISDRVLNGERPVITQHGNSLLDIAVMCWQQEPSQRPSIHELEEMVVESTKQ